MCQKGSRRIRKGSESGKQCHEAQSIDLHKAVATMLEWHRRCQDASERDVEINAKDLYG